MIGRENFFHKIKRHVSQFFETEYWYRFRKILSFWFDDEKNKFVESTDRTRARDIITSTWNGENDILGIMRLKIEHMFWNLKNHAWQSYFYIDSGYFFEEGATDEDRNLFVRQIIEEYEKNPKKYKYAWNFDHKESYSNLNCEKTSKKYSKKTPYCSYTNRWWIGNEETDDKTISESGLIHYYLFHDCGFDGWGHTTTWGIEKEYDVQIPPEQIPEKKKQYYVDFNEDDLGHREAPQYKTKKTEGVTYFPSCYGFKDIQKILDEKGIKIDVLKGFLTGAQTMDVSDMKIYTQLSPYMKSVARGNRRVLTDLLHLRHLIKKLNNLSDTDDVYYNMWKDEKDEEEQSKKVIEARKCFDEDRKKLYQEICDFMVKNGETWWD